MLPGWSLPLLFVVGAISQYLGAAIGVFLFDTTEPATVAWIRAVAAGLVLVLVTAGVGLLAGIQLDVEPVGVAFAVTAAAMWAGYIVVGKNVASTGDGEDSLAVGMAGAALVFAPIVLSIQLSVDATVFADPRTWILGVGVGMLSSALPYALDQVVLKAMGRQRFAMLLALLPATAVVVGAVVLAQWPHATELIGVGVVMSALTVAAWPVSRRSVTRGTPTSSTTAEKVD